MTLSPFDFVLLFGTTQGVILASLLGFTPSRLARTNRLLATIIGLLALACLNLVALENDVYQAHATLGLLVDLIPTVIIMPLGPLVWFYVRSHLEPHFRIRPPQRWHFLPLILDFIPALICWAFFLGLQMQLIDRSQLTGWGDIIDQYDQYVDLPRWVSLTIYVLLARRALQDFRPASKGPDLIQQQRSLPWIRQFLAGLLIFQVIWLLFLIPYLLPALRPTLFDKLGWYVIYVPITGLIYWFGFMGFVQARLVSVAQPKTPPTRLSADQVEQAMTRLRKAMETDQLFTDPDLTLDRLMSHTHLDQKTVSHVLNQHLGKSFNAFVNEYRVEAVKQRLLDPASRHLTITGVALECGFNSQATFQRAFKQFTGVSPSNYLAQQAALPAQTLLKSRLE